MALKISTSMEVGCKVDAERVGGGANRHILSAYLTFVCLDDTGKPRPVPALEVSDPIGERRYREAQMRRDLRLQHARQLRSLREETSA